MKRLLKAFLGLFIMCLMLLACQIVLAQSGGPNDTVNTIAEQIWMWIGVILAVYEILARMIPSLSDITILGNIINFLKAISDFFNRGLGNKQQKIT